MSMLLDLALAWQVIAILVFSLGNIVLDEKTKSKCLCGKSFAPSFPKLAQKLESLRISLATQQLDEIKEIVQLVTAILVLFQFIPIFFIIEVGWRWIKHIHTKRCLAYQVGRTESESCSWYE